MKEKIINNIYKSIEEIYESMDVKISLEKGIETQLFGGGDLDSLGLVNLIVSVEQNIEDEFNVIITISDDRALSQKHSPFRTVGSLANYIEILLKEKLND